MAVAAPAPVQPAVKSKKTTPAFVPTVTHVPDAKIPRRAKICLLYTSETSPVAAGCNDFVFVAGSVGHPLAGIELAIDSENPHEPGEILIRGPIVMNGYYRDETATKEAIDKDGWLHTGDLGMFDKRGVLTITGRLKSLIVLESGKKIFPEELEALLNQHEYVKDSLVYAQADERGDVVVSAKIILDKLSLIHI